MAKGISARYALTEQEFDFCKRHLAGLPAAEAYRRAFLFAKGGETFEEQDVDGAGKGEAIPSKEVSRRSSTLLRQEHIKAYLAELKNPAGDNARSKLLELAMFEGDRQAANAILEQEDKLGARDAYEHWAQIMCAIGTEVVLEVPGKGEVVVPLKALFPQFAEALPPDEVVRKTIKTLEEFLGREKFQTEIVPEEEADS